MSVKLDMDQKSFFTYLVVIKQIFFLKSYIKKNGGVDVGSGVGFFQS